MPFEFLIFCFYHVCSLLVLTEAPQTTGKLHCFLFFIWLKIINLFFSLIIYMLNLCSKSNGGPSNPWPQYFACCAGHYCNCHRGSNCLVSLQEVWTPLTYTWYLCQPNHLQQWAVPVNTNKHVANAEKNNHVADLTV